MRGIVLSGVSKSFGSKTVLESFDMELETGRIHVLYGPSGCGKSTLIHLLSKVTPIDSGELTTLPSLKETRIGVVFQEDRLLPWKTVSGNLEFVLGKGSGELIDGILKTVGLETESHKYPGELSGGMKRRVSLARCLAYDPSILLLDEPFTGMDRTLKHKMIHEIRHRFEHLPLTDRQGICVISTHHLDEAIAIADEIIVMDGTPLRIKGRFDISETRNIPECMSQIEQAILNCAKQ